MDIVPAKSTIRKYWIKIPFGGRIVLSYLVWAALSYAISLYLFPRPGLPMQDPLDGSPVEASLLNVNLFNLLLRIGFMPVWIAIALYIFTRNMWLPNWLPKKFTEALEQYFGRDTRPQRPLSSQKFPFFWP
jgi:hypothetical protein